MNIIQIVFMDEHKNFAWPVTTIGKYDYDALHMCIAEYREKFLNKRIVIFGAGIRGTSFSLMLKNEGYDDIVFTDNNEEKVGNFINEYPIIPYKEVEKLIGQAVVVISVENGYVLMEQLEKSGFVENENYFFIDNHLNEAFVKEFLRKGNFDTLVMGDCGFTDISIKDKDYRSISDLLVEKLGKDYVKILAIHAMGMRAFYNIFKAHINHICVPRKLLVMANFETFTGKQHLLPRSQHTKLIHMISQAVENSEDELREYADVTEERFSNLKMDYFTSSTSFVGVHAKERNDRIVIKMNYMYSLNRENECIVYLEKLLDLCKQRKINVVVFIPPANYMYAEKLYGDKFTKSYDDNVNSLKKILKEYDCSILDMSYSLTDRQFADTHTIDETANFEGRAIVADQIQSMIN